jgi:excisionase family DNA binding protein
MITNTDELRAQVHGRWQEQVLGAFQERGWQPPRHRASGGPGPWEEVASTAVEAIWSSVEPMVSPIVELLGGTREIDEHREGPTPARSSPDSLWLSADEVAPLLRTTAHSLRRFAREGRSPVPAHRVGGRWWFARAEVDRFLGAPDR